MREPSEPVMPGPFPWWMVIPGPIDRTTGGTIYDRRMVAGARAAGDRVTVVSLPGRFPADLHDTERDACCAALNDVPDGATVCVDGLVLPALPDELCSLARRCQMVALIHHPCSLEPGLSPDKAGALWRAELAVIHAAARVICTSRYTARLLAGQGVAPSVLAVVPPGVDLPATAASGSAAGPARLLCVANLMHRKGLNHLIEALAGIQRLDWSLTVVGSEEFEPETASRLHEMVHACGLARRVSFVGALSEAELARLYRRADLFVFPSLYEGYGMVLTEAAAYGLPIITTDGGAIPDTVAGLGADIVPAGDSGALAAAVERFLADDAHRSALAARSRAHRSQLPSWESAATSFRLQLQGTEADTNAAPVCIDTPGARVGDDARRARVGDETRGVQTEAITTESFDIDWLGLRELADHHFRSREPVERLNRHLTQRTGLLAATQMPCTILDLASGSGSNMRFIAPRLARPQHWLLCDMDKKLLDHGRQICAAEITSCRSNGSVTVATRVVNLAHDIPMELDGRTADLVTASALLDLVSYEWLERLAGRLSSADPAPLFLAATVYNGDVVFLPRDVHDDAILAAFRTDMRRDKGFGPALGDRAPAAAETLLTGHGFHVETYNSAWRLDEALAATLGTSRFTELCRRQLQFFVEAAESGDAETVARGDARGWLERRLAQLQSGQLQIAIGHCDLLAVRE